MLKPTLIGSRARRHRRPLDDRKQKLRAAHAGASCGGRHRLISSRAMTAATAWRFARFWSHGQSLTRPAAARHPPGGGRFVASGCPNPRGIVREDVRSNRAVDTRACAFAHASDPTTTGENTAKSEHHAAVISRIPIAPMCRTAEPPIRDVLNQIRIEMGFGSLVKRRRKRRADRREAGLVSKTALRTASRGKVRAIRATLS